MADGELSKFTLVFRGPQDDKHFFGLTDIAPLIGTDSAKNCWFQLLPEEQPKRFRISRQFGGKSYALCTGICELDGDRCRVCGDFRANADSAPVPKEFAAPAGSGLTLVTLKRIKDK